MFNALANSFNIYLVILIHGGLILLSLLFFSNVFKVNKKANIYFGAFLLIWSTYWIEEILSLSSFNPLNSNLIVGLRFIQFLTPILFYFGTVQYANPKFRICRKHLIFAILPIIYMAGLIYNEFDSGHTMINTVLNILVILHAIYFIFKSYQTIQIHKKKLIQFSSLTEEKDLKWIEQIIITILILVIFIFFYNLIFSDQYLNLFANLFSLTIVYFVAYNGVRQKEIHIIDIPIEEKDKTLSKKPILSDEDLLNYKVMLSELMKDQEPFLDPDLNLMQLANQINITPHQLSFLINEGFKENFFSFINKYRVEKVKVGLKNIKSSNLSIIGIAYDCGFNSKTAFYNTFKKITAMTPSEYIKKSSPL